MLLRRRRRSEAKCFFCPQEDRALSATAKHTVQIIHTYIQNLSSPFVVPTAARRWGWWRGRQVVRVLSSVLSIDLHPPPYHCCCCCRCCCCFGALLRPPSLLLAFLTLQDESEFPPKLASLCISVRSFSPLLGQTDRQPCSFVFYQLCLIWRALMSW